MEMTIEQTKKVIDKIKIYRPRFGEQFDKAGLDELKIEWFRVLEPYDFEDVDKKLDEYFKNGDNFGRFPDAYYLTKFLKTHDEKEQKEVYYVRCKLCGAVVQLDEYEQHYNKCLSIEYLHQMGKKYCETELDKNELLAMDCDQFEKYYWNFCEKLIDKMDYGLEKHCLKNAVFTHYGFEPEYGLQNIEGELKNAIR